MDQPPVPQRSVISSINFGFLAIHDPLLVRLAAQAESYVFTDPETSLFKLRSWVGGAAKVEGQKRGTRYVATKIGAKL
ncbi:MAG: hypothetical protein L6R48_10825 [Planctomycetes bacterium]|nr:hypothetical protein [Planctomycetota bacterium]